MPWYILSFSWFLEAMSERKVPVQIMRQRHKIYFLYLCSFLSIIVTNIDGFAKINFVVNGRPAGLELHHSILCNHQLLELFHLGCIIYKKKDQK